VSIATHDGPFHSDDLIAVALLRQILPAADVVRTRDPHALATCTHRVDVGGRADVGTGDFDHHFVGAPVRADGTRYAAAGLVWRAVGAALIGRARPALPPARIDALVASLDAALFAPLDRFDNGQPESSGAALVVARALCDANLTWSALATLGKNADGAVHARFTAVLMTLEPHVDALIDAVGWEATVAGVPPAVGRFVSGVVHDMAPYAEAWAAARVEARGVLRQSLHRGAGPVLTLDVVGLPWQDIGMIHALESDARRHVAHVVEPATDGTWLVTAVATAPGGFTSRVPFPAAWAGRRGPALEMASGLPGAVFCHPGCWISGWVSRDAAVAASEAARAAVVDDSR
jgi:uncharacterized UPF0160 family protein